MSDQFSPQSTSVTVDLPLHIDRASQSSVIQQLTEQLRQAITRGHLPPGTRLPSTRTLAHVLGVNRGAVLTAYDELLTAGYLVGRVGAGTFVSNELPLMQDGPPKSPALNQPPRWLRGSQANAEVSQDPPGPDFIDFQIGRPTVVKLSDAAWKRAWRKVSEEALPGTYTPAAGDPELRSEIAAYLRRSRGVVCEAEDVVITNGTIQGLHLVSQAVLERGDPVAFEEPGYRLARQVLREHGARILPVPVDDDGLQVAELPCGEAAPTLVYTTPSHQFPLGSRLSLPRRHALLNWAHTYDSLIVEDDYDGEFRYDIAPLPALASLNPSRVVYLGTFSKVLSPVLRVGYLVAPQPLRERVTQLKVIADYHTSWPVQRALTFFLRSGDLERHLRRMRRTYAHKRTLLVRELAGAQAARIGGLEAGFHVHLELDPEVNSLEVAKRCQEQKVLVSSLEPFYMTQPAVNGLLLGYGGLEPSELIEGARRLAGVLNEFS